MEKMDLLVFLIKNDICVNTISLKCAFVHRNTLSAKVDASSLVCREEAFDHEEYGMVESKRRSFYAETFQPGSSEDKCL